MVRILENMALRYSYTLTLFLTTCLEFGSAEQLRMQCVGAVGTLLFIKSFSCFCRVSLHTFWPTWQTDKTNDACNRFLSTSDKAKKTACNPNNLVLFKWLSLRVKSGRSLHLSESHTMVTMSGDETKSILLPAGAQKHGTINLQAFPRPLGLCIMFLLKSLSKPRRRF